MADKEYVLHEWTDDRGVHEIKAGELIRCKDCKYFRQSRFCCGDFEGRLEVNKYDFCSRAKRKEE